MWISPRRLGRLGFRRVSPRYWLCFRRYGLHSDSHLTLPAPPDRDLLELAAFHVTFEVGRERLHFYYREEGPAAWRLEGHTPSADFHRLGADRDRLRQAADAAAQRLVAALGARWLPDIAGSGLQEGDDLDRLHHRLPRRRRQDAARGGDHGGGGSRSGGV